jgi:biotin synthase-related radical SAM superfamily protein
MANLVKNKEDIFGKVLQPKIKGSFDIEEKKLKEPLYYDGSAVRCFCFGCGTSTELVQAGAEHLAKIAEVSVPLSWQGFYFVSEQCIVCTKNYRNVILKKI